MKTKLSVTLIGHTPQPEKIIAAAAKLCYSKTGAKDIMEDLTDENTDKFLKSLMSMGHASPIEHVAFNFAIEGVSRTLSHQLVRHRLASYSQQSQRYVDEGAFKYIIPPNIEAIPFGEKMFIDAMKEAQQTYDMLTTQLTTYHFHKLKKEGIEEGKAYSMAEKSAIEDARFVLPNACETKLVATMNVRTLHHFFNQRTCNRAQWEIRELAIAMLGLCKAVAPTLFIKAGPPCLVGPCPEGKMTCGKIDQVRETFSK